MLLNHMNYQSKFNNNKTISFPYIYTVLQMVVLLYTFFIENIIYAFSLIICQIIPSIDALQSLIFFPALSHSGQKNHLNNLNYSNAS